MSADPVAALELKVQKAEDLWRRGMFAAALQQYTALLRERLLDTVSGAQEQATLTAADMVIAERVSDLAMLFGQTDAADDLLAGVAARVGQEGNFFWADFVTAKRIDLALGSDHLRQAYDLLREMIPRIGDVTEIEFSPVGMKRWESECHWPQTDDNDRTVIFTLLYLLMGRLLSAVGQYGEAIRAIERGLFHTGVDDAPDLARRAIIPLNLALATALLEKGALPESEMQLAMLEPSQQPGWFVRWLELGGKLHLLKGNFGAALEKFRSAISFCERHRFEKAVLSSSVNLTHALIYLNQTAEARNTLEAVRVRAEAMGDQQMKKRTDALLSLAHARRASLADTVSITSTVIEHWALTGVRSASAEFEPDTKQKHLELPQSDNYLAFFEDRTLEFYWLLSRGDTQAASVFLNGMKESFRDSDSLLIQERLRVLNSVLAYYQGDYQRAEISLSRSLQTLQDLELRPELWQAQRLLGWCMAKLARPQVSRDALAEETSRLLDEMTDSLPHEDRAVFLLNKWTAEEEYIAGEVEHLVHLKAMLENALWWRKPVLSWRLWQRLDALMAYIDRYKLMIAQRTVKGEEATTDAAFSKTSVWRRLWRHPRHEVRISFLVLPDRVLIIRAGWLSLDFGVSAATRIQVREFVHNWHVLVRRVIDQSRGLGALPGSPPAHNASTVPESIANESDVVADGLASILQLPAILDNLPRATRALTIVPDDSLHGFPFAAIRHNGRYLIEDFALSYGFEIDEISMAIEVNGRKSLVVGVSEGTRELPPLPCVRDEVELVINWLKRRQIMGQRLSDTDGQACRPDKITLLKYLSEVSFVHVACHGIFKPDLPDQSGMILPSSTGQFEVLSVRELSALNLQNLKHITLSSCWSADHFILPGRWVISLPETLHRAGAGSILGCLWLVNDLVGVEFMSRFYQYLDTLTRQEALRQAQLDCLNDRLKNVEGIDTTHPIYWAGYHLYGNNSELRL